MTDSSPSGKDLPSGWSVSPLEDVADILDGKRVPVNAKERETRTGKIPYYGATGQVGWIDDYLFDEELVLLGEDGAPFLDASRPKAYVIRGKSWVNNHAHVLRAKDGTPNAYLKYFLDRFDYHGFVTGTTRLKLTQGAMRQIPIPLAPPDDRKRIVAEVEKQFSRLDEAVVSLKRIKANLKRYKAAVLKAAVEGKLTEDWRKQHPDVEPASKLLERILAERRTKWKDKGKYKEPTRPDITSLPSLPTGWIWTIFEQVSLRVTVGHVGPMKHEYVPSGVPFLRSQNVRENKFDPEGLLFIQPKFHAKLSKSVIRGGDMAVVRSGSVGVTCVIPETLGEANCADLVLIQSPIGLVPKFGAYYMNSLAKRRVEAGKVGVALTHFNTKSVATMPIPLPPFAEQGQIVAEVERRLSVIQELEATVEANLTRADRLRQATLNAAFSGCLGT